MKLTVTGYAPYKTGKGREMVKVSLESEPVVQDSANNFFTLNQRKITKSFDAPVAEVMFPEQKTGSVVDNWVIRTVQTFVPDQSIAQEVEKGVTKPQQFSLSKNTKKLYLSDGKPFFAKLEFRKAGGTDTEDILLPNITSVACPQAMLDGLRPSGDDMAALGYALDPSTVAKLNQPLTVATVVAPRAETANAIG